MLCVTLYLRAIFQVQDPGGLILGGAISRSVFYVTSLGELIHRGANFRNFTVVSAWDSNMASFKCAFTRILNEILVNFLVSGTNELGKVWEETEEENLVPVVKIVKGTGEDSGRGSVKFEEGFPPIHSGLPLPPLINDRFLINLFTGWDYLSALNNPHQTKHYF